MDKFKAVLSIADKQHAQFGFGLVVLLTAGGEQIFSSVVFKCPCNSWNFVYGLVFLLVPALMLLVLGYILSKKTWKLFTGICHRKAMCRWRNLAASGMILFHISTAALVAPSSWIAVALLNGNYFECAMTGLNITAHVKHLCRAVTLQDECMKELMKFPCERAVKVSQVDSKSVLLSLRAESQILGWLLISCMLVSNLLLTCVARCNSPISYLQLKFWKTYAQEENNLMDSYSEKHCKVLAERNLKSFFQQLPPEPIITPSNHAWQSISALYRFNTKDHYYSTLHQCVEKHQGAINDMRMDSVKSGDTSSQPLAVLNFVDEGRMML
ncbi:calcium homeostasis modulator protein 6 [Genypterus blacodes]|uniref:calcium homeostasis modulator protein 6 n=1 Tax=Genypterus blacodes TaxID=154954 RepID=UPI003F768BBA